MDARIPDRWLNDRRILRLSDAELVTFFMTLTWSVSNRTDGHIEPDDLELIPRADRRAARGLVARGLWARGEVGWHIVDFTTTQTTRSEHEVLENARRREREKKARQRARPRPTVPGDSPGGGSRGKAQDRTGQARTGEAGQASRSGVPRSEDVSRQDGQHGNEPWRDSDAQWLRGYER